MPRPLAITRDRAISSLVSPPVSVRFLSIFDAPGSRLAFFYRGHGSMGRGGNQPREVGLVGQAATLVKSRQHTRWGGLE